MIIENYNGDQLLEMINIDENKILQEYAPVTHALVVVKNKGNYFHKEDKVEYGALYCADILEDIDFKENSEMADICLYESGMDIGYINEIDKKLLEYYK